MQPFLQNSNNATNNPQSSEVPKYLELLADNEDAVSRENPTNGYEVPRSIHVSDQNLTNIGRINGVNQDRKCSLPTESTQERKETRSTEEQKQFDGKLYDKRSSITSLNLPDRRGASVTDTPEKCNTLDSLKSVNSVAKAALKRNSFSSLNGQRKYKTSLSERRDSEASIEDRSCSSHSLAPSTRPSSSLINSQTVLPCLKNVTASNVTGNGEVSSNESTASTKNTLSKIQRTHSNLQNGKANIPLVINSALLNLLRQTPVVEDGNSIVTYTNINADAVKVNGSWTAVWIEKWDSIRFWTWVNSMTKYSEEFRAWSDCIIMQLIMGHLHSWLLVGVSSSSLPKAYRIHIQTDSSRNSQEITWETASTVLLKSFFFLFCLVLTQCLKYSKRTLT